jgi:predicted transposase YdaD
MGETAKPFDNGSKRLLAISGQALLDWIAPSARFTGQFSEQFHSVEIEADAMIETDCNGQREFVHFEFQSGSDPDMTQRLLEYYIQAYRRYRCSIRSYVLYLRKSGELPVSPLIRTHSNGKEFLHFHFETIPLCDISHREILDQDRQKLFPLVPLMDGGASHKVIDEIIDGLLPLRDKMYGKELLNLTSLFSGLAFKAPEDKVWVRRRFDMLKDIFEESFQHQYYKDLVRDEVLPEVRKEVRAQEREKGREEGRQELLIALHKSLRMIVQARFPTLTQLAKTQSRHIKDVTIMNEVLGKVGAAQTIEEAMNVLLNCLPSDDTEEE